MHRNTPIFPGAMTPAQFAARAETIATAAAGTAAAVALFTIIFIMFI